MFFSPGCYHSSHIKLFSPSNAHYASLKFLSSSVLICPDVPHGNVDLSCSLPVSMPFHMVSWDQLRYYLWSCKVHPRRIIRVAVLRNSPPSCIGMDREMDCLGVALGPAPMPYQRPVRAHSGRIPWLTNRPARAPYIFYVALLIAPLARHIFSATLT